MKKVIMQFFRYIVLLLKGGAIIIYYNYFNKTMILEFKINNFIYIFLNKYNYKPKLCLGKMAQSRAPPNFN